MRTKELCENNRYSMRRMNSSWQGGGVRHSGAMSNDDNAVMAGPDKQNEVIIAAQFLSHGWKAFCIFTMGINRDIIS